MHEHPLPLMARVSYYVAASLDGYIAGPQGQIDWLQAFDSATQDYGYADFLARVDGLVMGRKTFENALGMGAWPYPGRPTWVLTRRREAAPDSWPAGVEPTDASPTELQQVWRERSLAHVWLVGGSDVAAAFLACGQLHELIISTLPVTLGGGRRLFAESAFARQAWRLQRVEHFDNGLVQAHYLAASR